MKKLNWRVPLFNYFNDIRRVPFDKDTNNCAQFIANGYVLVSDDQNDPFAKYRKHASYEALLRAVKKDGFANHSDFFATFLPQYLHPSQAKVGDIAIFPMDDEIGELAGWVIGTHVFVLRPDGLATYPLANAIKAFEV